MYHKETVYFIGEAKSPENNPITSKYQMFFVGFVIDRTNDFIIDADCTAMIGITERFIQSLFIGRNMLDSDDIINQIKNRYFGSSQKALIVAFKNAQKKYSQSIQKLIKT